MAARRFGDFGLRVLSVLVLAPVTLLCLWVGGGAWAVLVAIAAAGVGAEWAGICGFRASTLPGVILPVLVATVGLAAAAGKEWVALGALLAAAALFALGGWRMRAGRSWLAGGTLYVGVAAIAMVWLRFGDPGGRLTVLFVVLIVWASDIGAYFFGRLIGGPKLAPRISPGKTWAGAAGGLALAVLVGVAMAGGFSVAVSARVVLIAIVLSLASQGGDLLESALKRRFGVKDSGVLIPGHGGVLDRLDGMLAAAPIAAILVLAWPGAGQWL